MVGLMQLMIWLFCIYLVFKGVEIFQIAWMSVNEGKRTSGMSLGFFMIALAFLIGVVFVILEEGMVNSISDKMNTLPNFGR
jgi:uncharacterized membrane protein (DUF485 family)